jgi:hypothetical protein
MGIKRIKTRSQRITSSGYLKKNSRSKNRCQFWLFQKTSQNCSVSRKPGKKEPGRFLGGYFTFTIWDLSFRTLTDGQTGSEFQDLDRQTHRSGFQDLNKRTDGIWVSGPRHTDIRDLSFRTSTDRRTNLGFRTSTNGQTGSGFQDLDR